MSVSVFILVALFVAVVAGWLIAEGRRASPPVRIGFGIAFAFLAFGVGLSGGQHSVGMQRAVDRSQHDHIFHEVERRLAEDDLEGAQKCIEIFRESGEYEQAKKRWETYLSERKPSSVKKGTD